MKDRIRRCIEGSIKAKEELLVRGSADIEKAAALLISSLSGGGKVLVFGNGGSAADSQHMAAELIGRFKKERRAIPAIALTTDTSVLTSLANDYSFDIVFARQIEALGRPGDIAFGISTSGNSGDVIEAIKKAGSLGLKTIALTAGDGGKLAKLCDAAITVPSSDTPRAQESHILVIHILCELAEDALAKR